MTLYKITNNGSTTCALNISKGKLVSVKPGESVEIEIEEKNLNTLKASLVYFPYLQLDVVEVTKPSKIEEEKPVARQEDNKKEEVSKEENKDNKKDKKKKNN